MTETDTRTDPATGRPPNPWVPMSVIVAATIMVGLDSTIVNVALHAIGEDLRARDGIEWVVTAYLLAVCASQPATGWLADRFGRKPMFLLALTWFTVASVLCALAPNLLTLVLFRALQGLGGGAIMPIGMAMGLSFFPAENKGRAMAIWGVASMAAPAIGPTLGGWLVDSVSWHWMFLINLPIGLGAVLGGLRLLPGGGHRERRPFDGLGLFLGGAGLSLAVLGLMQGNSWGWASASTVSSLAVGVVMLGLFGRHELRHQPPLIELRLFQERNFRLAVAALALIMLPQYARLVFLPLALQGLRGFSAMKVGVLFFPAGVGSAIGMTIGGRLVDRIGPRRPILVGCAGVFVSMVLFWRLSIDAPAWWIVALMSLQGAAWGMTATPGMVAGLGKLPPRYLAQGTTIRSLTGQVSAAMAVAVLGAVVAIRMGDATTPAQRQAAFNSSYLLGALCTVGAFLVARHLPDSVETPEPGESGVVPALHLE